MSHSFKAYLRIPIILFLVIYLQASAFAQTDTTYRSVFGFQPLVLPQGFLHVETQTAFPNYFKFLNSTSGVMESLPGNMVYNEAMLNLIMEYGLNNRWDIFGDFGVVSIHSYSPSGMAKGIGLNDLELGVRYQLINSDNKPDGLAFALSTTLPTGKKGNPSEKEYPTGLDAFSFQAELTGLKEMGSGYLIYTGEYVFISQNSNLINPGDKINLAGIWMRPFQTEYGFFSLEAGMETSYTFSDKSEGVSINDPHGFQVKFLPGMSYRFPNKLNLGLGIPVTIYQYSAWLSNYTVMLQLSFIIH